MTALREVSNLNENYQTWKVFSLTQKGFKKIRCLLIWLYFRKCVILKTFQHTLIHSVIEFCERFTKVGNHENAEEKKKTEIKKDYKGVLKSYWLNQQFFFSFESFFGQSKNFLTSSMPEFLDAEYWMESNYYYYFYLFLVNYFKKTAIIDFLKLII